MTDDLARAALDPNAAVAAPAPVFEVSSERYYVTAPVTVTSQTSSKGLDLVLSVEIPKKPGRVRFFVFWVLIKLASRVMRFSFEIYRPRAPWE